MVYVPAFEPPPLINVSSPKVEISVLWKCIGVLGSMLREREVLPVAGGSCACLRKNVPCLNFSNTRILGLIVKSRLVSLKIYFSVFSHLGSNSQ